MRDYDYVIVGGGLTAANAVEGIRQVDEDGSIVVLSEEEEPPYHRPPLSKEFLQAPGAGRDMLHVKPEGWYGEEAGAELALGDRVTGLDPDELTVETAGGETFRGERILLATGGRPRRLDLRGSGMEGVHVLRTVEDSEALRREAGDAEHALLIGAGFIGMELAASFRELDVRPTVVELAGRVWSRLLPAGLSSFMEEYFLEREVEFRLRSSVQELRGDGRVESAVLHDGTEIPCQLAVVGVGIEPNQELAGEAGLGVQDGVVVDSYGETSHGYVYAAGDVARFPDPVFGDLTRVEHWDHARAHGKRVGRNMAGENEAYDHLSYFFSEVFDLSLNAFGRPAEAVRTASRGEPGSEEGCVVFCADDQDKLCATVILNDNDALEDCRELVRRRPDFDELEERLADPGVKLAEVGG